MRKIFYAGLIAAMAAGTQAIAHEGEHSGSAQSGTQSDQQVSQAGSESGSTEGLVAESKQAGQQAREQAEQTTQQAREQAGQTVAKRESREVSGQIVAMKEVEVRGTNAKNRVVMLKTSKNDRRLVVDLGPATGLQGIQLKEGNEIAVSGPIVEIRDRTFLVADKLKSGDKTVEIQRSPQEKQHAQRGQQPQQQGGASEQPQPS